MISPKAWCSPHHESTEQEQQSQAVELPLCQSPTAALSGSAGRELAAAAAPGGCKSKAQGTWSVGAEEADDRSTSVRIWEWEGTRALSLMGAALCPAVK